MTITPPSDGWWELHTRHGILVSSGSLYAMVCLWARMKRDWWCDIPYGAGEPGCTIECTCTHDCHCRACTAATERGLALLASREGANGCVSPVPGPVGHT
jgi:hypothetical protein